MYGNCEILYTYTRTRTHTKQNGIKWLIYKMHLIKMHELQTAYFQKDRKAYKKNN